MEDFHHVTVLLKEAVAGLAIKPTGVYVDCTLGGGGHSQRILEQLTTGHLYAFDQDQTAITYTVEHLKTYLDAGKLTFIKSNFRQIQTELTERGITQVDG
ncbi:16S rRNA (cytosine(1402)-N(4))-methyltransferase, partial [Levilactobacillus brevis]|nr:16S rRNA (cytosine(1402)-N(4))-methyltransferase [Levilactobacillus brevis]